MAEAIFEKLSGAKAQSAGIDPSGGDWEVDPNALTALKEIGAETKNLKVKKLTEEMLEKADKIIAFRCADKIPEKYKSKVENWELGSQRQIGGKQPERTLDEIRKMQDLIYQNVKRLLKELKL